MSQFCALQTVLPLEAPALRDGSLSGAIRCFRVLELVLSFGLYRIRCSGFGRAKGLWAASIYYGLRWLTTLTPEPKHTRALQKNGLARVEQRLLAAADGRC